jgi:hypothetical protein
VKKSPTNFELHEILERKKENSNYDATTNKENFLESKFQRLSIESRGSAQQILQAIPIQASQQLLPNIGNS